MLVHRYSKVLQAPYDICRRSRVSSTSQIWQQILTRKKSNLRLKIHQREQASCSFSRDRLYLIIATLNPGAFNKCSCIRQISVLARVLHTDIRASAICPRCGQLQLISLIHCESIADNVVLALGCGSNQPLSSFAL